MSDLPIRPIIFFEGPAKAAYTSRIDPIKREIEYQKREKKDRKQKQLRVEARMNELAKGFAETMLSYGPDGKATNSYYYAFDRNA